jgi:hypothetical protein
MSAYCHNRPLKGSGKCGAHTLRQPAETARELAHQQVSIAIREGVLVRPDACELCSSKKGDWRTWLLHAHHEDYDRPLDVIWLCVPCHSRVHGVHGGLPAYIRWARAQLDGAERLAVRFAEQSVPAQARP